MDFFEREENKLNEIPSREKAFAFSLDEIEGNFNNWVLRDTYSNKIIEELIDDFLKKEDSLKKESEDSFLQIVNYTLNSLEKIIKNPKKKLIKISELQDINKIASTDLKTMIWLGSKPGRNLIEKIGTKGKVLAPKNIYSIDKKENRIVNYYFKKVLEILEMRSRIYTNNLEKKSEIFEYIYNKFYKLKREMIENNMYYLKRPLDFEPNNTIIDHRDYSVINRGLNLLNLYIKESDYNEEHLLKKGMFLVFIKLLALIIKLKDTNIIKKFFNVNEIIKQNKEKVTFYIEKEKLFRLNIELLENNMNISLEILKLDKITKNIYLEENIFAEHFTLNLSKNYDDKKNILKIKILEKEFPFNYIGLDEIAKEIFFKITSFIGEEKKEKTENKNLSKNTYLNLNSLHSYLNDQELEITNYSKNLNTFLSSKDYYKLEEDHIISINKNLVSGENLEIFSRFLEKLEEINGVNREEILIFSTLENLNAEFQRNISSIINSKFKSSYPIWRSILATYALDSKKNWSKNDDVIFILDLNGSNTSINQIKKINNKYEHHPILIEESENLEKISLEMFLKYYLNEYLEKNNIILNQKERDNLIYNGKLLSVISGKEKISIVIKGNDIFYLEKDQKIYENLVEKFKKEILIFIKNIFSKIDSKNKKIILLVNYISEINFGDNLEIEILKEEELILGKNNIIEKISKQEAVWSEFLPNLKLEIVKNQHFYDLELINNKAVELKLGEENIFEVEETLILPEGKTEIIKFPLKSEDSLEKKTYFLEVKSSTFPLKEPLEVKLEIGYLYGNKNPYKIIIHSIKDSNIKFETKWSEQTMGKIFIKKIEFPEIKNIFEREIDRIFKKLEKAIEQENTEKLIEILKTKKNRFRKFIVKQVNEGNTEYIIGNLLNHPIVKQLLKQLEENNNNDLHYHIKVFLASFGVFSPEQVKVKNAAHEINKRCMLFTYNYYGTYKLNINLEKSRLNTQIRTISELGWLDKDFIKGIITYEQEILKSCLNELNKYLNDLRKNFDKIFKQFFEKNKLWVIANDFRDCLEFLLSLFLVDKKDNILFDVNGNLKIDKKLYIEILNNLKIIDRKIQLENKYQELKEAFDNSVRVKLEIENKNELEKMSDLAYTVINYMTGIDGSDLIKIKEIVDKN